MGKYEDRESVVLENEGLKLFGIFHRPHATPPFPALLICHGLGGHKAGKYRLYVTLAEQLCKAGFAVFRFDFRGSGDSEGDFSDMTIESEVSDAMVAFRYLKSRPDVDPKRVGLFGRSVGGMVGLIAASRLGWVKSIGLWAPVYDGNPWYEQYQRLHSEDVPPEHREERMRINGQVPGKEFFVELFGLHMDDNLKRLDSVPMMHIHGDQDRIVTAYHADHYSKIRQHAKGLNRFICMENSDHDFTNAKERQEATATTIDWFSKTL